MRLFILFVFVVYGGAHVYTFLRARSALAFGPLAGFLLAAFMVLMVFALFLVRALEQHDYELPARALAYIAYFWMAVLFLFFCGSLLFDLAGLAIRTRGMDRPLRCHPGSSVSARMPFFVSLGLSLSICTYGYFEARNIRPERVAVETAKLPPGIDRLTIAQISDVHLGLILSGAIVSRKCSRSSKQRSPTSFCPPATWSMRRSTR